MQRTVVQSLPIFSVKRSQVHKNDAHLDNVIMKQTVLRFQSWQLLWGVYNGVNSTRAKTTNFEKCIVFTSLQNSPQYIENNLLLPINVTFPKQSH